MAIQKNWGKIGDIYAKYVDEMYVVTCGSNLRNKVRYNLFDVRSARYTSVCDQTKQTYCAPMRHSNLITSMML